MTGEEHSTTINRDKIIFKKFRYLTHRQNSDKANKPSCCIPNLKLFPEDSTEMQTMLDCNSSTSLEFQNQSISSKLQRTSNHVSTLQTQ
jgi:hypothetical protein